ncbi:hypothetical protein TUM15762_20020 [Neisseria gonorrhoeae]|nr:hypothetical protein TUM15762_20020 [Neisseria gonorrhoeae]
MHYSSNPPNNSNILFDRQKLRLREDMDISQDDTTSKWLRWD